MSYKNDLSFFASEQAKRRKNIILSIKITVIILAVSFIMTALFLVLDLVKDSSRGGGNDGGGSGGGADRQPPVIRLKEGDAIYMDYGSNIALKSQVVVTDDSGTFTIDVDQMNLNKDVPGRYTVRYIATDGSGNKSYLDVMVVVTKQEYSYATLMSLIKNKADDIGISDNMTKRQKIEAFYEYVNINRGIEYDLYTDSSNIPDIDRRNWETDWIEEATLTLQNGKGDCYSYYSVSKAFFEYFGIEHVGIQRDNTNIKGKGTHFWLVVNIGEQGTNGQWYYFDATRLRYNFSDGTGNACLITLKKLQSYYQVNGDVQGYDFYAFDPAKYPTASTLELK